MTRDEYRVHQLLSENSAIWLPPPDLTVSQWADAERRISPEASAEPGMWRTSRAEYQRAIMDAIGAPGVERVVVMTSAQIGKALDVDTPVATIGGFKRIEDLSAGDVVFNEAGEQCRVLWRSEVMHGRVCYKVTFSDGAEIIADAEHNWAVDYERNGERAAAPSVMTTREMLPLYRHRGRNCFAVPGVKHFGIGRRRIVGITEVPSRPVCCIAVDSPSHLYLAGRELVPTHNSEVLLNTIGYFIDQEPSPILMIQPTIEMGQAFSKDRLAPMIRDTPVLQRKIKDPRARDSGNTLLAKAFVGGSVTIAGANSPASLASRPIRVLLCDEVDRYPVSAGSEGDPLTLAMKRTQNFWNRCVVWVSTPTNMGTSRIEKAYNASSMETWTLPCPSCGAYQPVEWRNIAYKDLSEPVMACVKCGQRFNEMEWKAHQEQGRWEARAPDVRNVRGFHLNAFASPWASWRHLTAQYEEAYRNGEEELKVWWNTVLGLPYENQIGTIELESMDAHREMYGAELPDGVLCLTCGVDTQDDRLELEVVGWGIGKESWGIEYRVIYGDPGQREVWEELDAFLGRTWTFANGEAMGLSCTCIDSAGHFTDEVYRYCKRNARRNIFPIVGRGLEGLPSVSKPTRNNRRRVALFKLGVTTIKGSLFSRLKTEKRGPGYCHFPLDVKTGHRGYDAVYFKGLLSERMVVKRVRGRDTVTWEPRAAGVRNEPLDVRVYATGALELYNPNLEAKQRRRAVTAASVDKPVKTVKKRSEPNAKVIKQPIKAAPRRVRVMRRGLNF